MKTWTIEQMIAENPCRRPVDYQDPKYLKTLWGDRETVTLLDIAEFNIPSEDRIWVATRPNALTPTGSDRWLTLIVTRAIKTHSLNCGIVAVENWAQSWLSGEDRTKESAESAASAASAARTARAAWAESAESAQQIQDLISILKGGK